MRHGLREQIAQHRRIDRLQQAVIDRRGFAVTVALRTPTGHRDHHDVASPGLLAQPARHLVAVQLGQADVEQHDVRLERFGGLSDEEKRALDEMQKATDDFIHKLDDVAKKKEQEILTV